MRLIHLSDVHYNKNSHYEFDKFLIPALFKDLESINTEKKIDFVIVSGDLIDKAGMSLGGSYKALKKVEDLLLNPILKKLHLEKQNLLICPGNHEIERDKDDRIIENGLLTTLVDVESVNDFIDKNKNNETGKLERIINYKTFEKEFYSDLKCPHKITNFELCLITKIDGLNVGITTLNSSWRCYSDFDKGQLIIGEKQIIDALDFIQDCQLKIAIFHHPYDWLIEFEKKIIESYLTKNYNLLFNGHIHKGNSQITNNFYGKLFISIAQSSMGKDIRTDSRDLAPGYCIVDYDYPTAVSGLFRKYNHLQNQFVDNTDLGNNGRFYYQIPSSGELVLFEKESKIIKETMSDKFDEINTHLISYGTDSISPKNVEEIFVMPDIIDQPNYDLDSEVECYDLKYFIEEENNFIVFGKKESGKTILLDRLSIEISKKFNDYRKLPAYINFCEMENREIISIIRDFLSIRIGDLKQLLKENKIILLIDNISFRESDKHKISKILQFIDLFPNIKIITTSNTLIPNVTPTEFLEYPKLKLTPKFIQDFKGQHIRELIRKWFRNKQTIDFQNNLEKLIDSYRAFELPRTPLTISIFLWIIEKQEFNPINKSTLIERFIEGLLEKLKTREILSSTFDYSNKIRLLAAIAEKILEKENNDDCLHYSEAITFIHIYLKQRSLEKIYSSEDIFVNFIKSSILLRDVDDQISFRFPCFFEFFLAKQMEYEKEFFNKVFLDDNFLDYTNEIDYYTGLNRGEKEILSFVFEKLKDTYKDINKQSDTSEIDKFFEIKNSFLSSQNISDLKKKRPTEEELNKYYDKQINSLPVAQSIPKKLKSKERDVLYKTLKLSAQILKNSEEVKDFELKKNLYDHIIKSSISYLIILKLRILDYLIKYKKNPDFIPENMGTGLFLRFLPLIHQIIIYEWLGSNKLTQIINTKIEEDLKNKSISELEKFISVFIYADIKGKNYLSVINKFSKHVKSNYIFDLLFFKVISYYYLRYSISTQMEKEFLNLLSKAQLKVMGMGKKDKSSIIKKLKDNWEKRRRENLKKQTNNN